MDVPISTASQHQMHKVDPARSLNDVEEIFALSKLAPEASCENVGSNFDGLTGDEAERRLKNYGLNLVTRERKPTIFQEIWARARSPLNSLLLSLAVVS